MVIVNFVTSFVYRFRFLGSGISNAISAILLSIVLIITHLCFHGSAI